MKNCKTCKIEKPLDQFTNHKIMKDGKNLHCKECKSGKDKSDYKKNSEVRKIKASSYYEKNREKILANKDPEKQKKYCSNFRSNNVEYIKHYKKEYKQLNKESITIYNREYRRSNRRKIQDQWNQKLKTDPLFKLRVNMGKRLNDALRERGLSKSTSIINHIGCSIEALVAYLEAQFDINMSWENYGSYWSVDHIIPLSAAKNEHQMQQLSHYTNLQPMEAKANSSKGNSMVRCWQKFQKDKNVDEDRATGMPFDLSVNEFVLAAEEFSPEHREFITKYEWLGKVGFGVRWVFTARWNGNLAGVIMMSEPNNYQFGQVEALIQRGAVSSWAPTNLNSKLVMFGCRWMVQHTTKRIFTAYSDPDAGEIGTIYQACNFDFLGKEYGADYLYQLLDGRQVNRRYFTRTSSMKKWAKELGIEWQNSWCKENGFQNPDLVPQILKDYANSKAKACEKFKQNPKGKYVLLLNYGKNKSKKTWEAKPYPKRDM
jgi:hypothetical protein